MENSRSRHRRRRLIWPGLLLYLYLAITFGVIAFGDWFIDLQPADRGLRIVVRLSDSLVHGLVAVAATAPLLATLPGRSRWAAAVLVAGLATGLDVDHLLAARSLSLSRLFYLPRRPATHSLTFSLAASALAGQLGWLAGHIRRSKGDNGSLPESHSPAGWASAAAWLAFAALASHVLRDAPSGAPILWPLPYLTISAAAYYVGEATICTVSYALAWRLKCQLR